MNIKTLFTFSLLWIASITLLWCSSTPVEKSLDGDQFEEKHADEMQKKADKSWKLVWESSPTLDLLMPETEQDITSETVEYVDWIKWFLAYPEWNQEAPWIIVIHERRWLNEHIKDMARVLAMNWYRALAVDLYRWEVATDMETARSLSTSLDKEASTTNLLAAESYLRNKSSKVASIWRCLWWAQSLQLSLTSDSLDATVIYYWRLNDNVEQLKNINQPVLGIFAENDSWIPPSDVNLFQEWLDAAWKDDYEIKIYPWVWHAFANPTWGNYEQEATIDARNKTLTFLDNELN